jgi:Leucine-rich repeat (LRR) protein
LKNLSSLRFLHLSNNNIQDIQIISFLIHLNELDLSYNQIRLIPNTFEKLIDLQYLNLSNNQINSWNNIVRINLILKK